MIGKMKPEPAVLADLIMDSIPMLSYIGLRQWHAPVLNDYSELSPRHRCLPGWLKRFRSTRNTRHQSYICKQWATKDPTDGDLRYVRPPALSPRLPKTGRPGPRIDFRPASNALSH